MGRSKAWVGRHGLKLARLCSHPTDAFGAQGACSAPRPLSPAHLSGPATRLLSATSGAGAYLHCNGWEWSTPDREARQAQKPCVRTYMSPGMPHACSILQRQR